jgi:O-antigen/teichoic acid export membrane protein
MVDHLLSKFHGLIKRDGFVKYFFNTGWLLLDKVLRLTLGLFVGVLVARYLGPDDFGVLNYAISIVALFAAFGKLGLDNIIIRNIVKEPDKRDVLLGTAFILKNIGSIALLLIVFFVLQFTNTTGFEQNIVIIISFAQIFVSVEVIDFYFQSQVKAKYSGFVSIISTVFFVLIRIFFVVYKYPLEYFAIAIVLEQAIKGFLYIVFYKVNSLKILNWRYSNSVAKTLLKDSGPLILSSLVVMVYMRIDQIMIKEMIGNSALGQYSAAVRLSEAWYFIPAIIGTSFFPAIIQAKKIGKLQYFATLQNLYDIVVWFGILVALPVTFLSDWIIELLYGSAFNEAGTVLMLHIWTGVFVGISIVKGRWQVTENLTKLHFYGAITSAIINVVLNYLFIPFFGIKGAAIATLIAQFSSAYGINYFFKELRSQTILIHKSFNLKRIFNESYSSYKQL